MKVAIFDAFSGAGGDMIVASLLGVSLSESDLENVVESLKLNIDFKVKRVEVKGLVANRVIVKEDALERTFREVVDIIERSELNERVKNDVKSIFEILARAEAEVHGDDYRNAVFHEVGGDDAIFDIVCSAIGIRRLIERGYTFFANTIRLGSGFVEFSHGKYPVPAPATVNILKRSNLEVVFGGEGELLTPTAAAVFAYYCKGSFRIPFKVENVSYGAGSRESDVPNVLRLILGKTAFSDAVTVLETTVDDISGEVLGFAMEKLISTPGVLDVVVLPAFVKKSRPAAVVKVVSELSKAEEVAEELMKLTGSLGVRIIPIHHRMVAEREVKEVEVEVLGRKFKVRYKSSKPYFDHIKPEFDDIVAIAKELNLSPLKVYREVMRVLEDADSDG